ncbi:MAG: hypothetical protein IPO31_23985 [Candidatus Obscuribacter sp.]|nr:hypothetical protein [Candidatus Obscuribacter sp.]
MIREVAFVQPWSGGCSELALFVVCFGRVFAVLGFELVATGLTGEGLASAGAGNAE